MFQKYATFYLKKCPKTLGVAPSLTPPTKVLLLLLVYLVIETIIRLFAFFNSLDVASIAAKTTIPSFLYLEISGYV